MELQERVAQILADVLSIDASLISETTSRDNTPQWDSLAHINVITALEEEFAVSFDVLEIEGALTFPDLLLRLEEKL